MLPLILNIQVFTSSRNWQNGKWWKCMGFWVSGENIQWKLFQCQTILTDWQFWQRKRKIMWEFCSQNKVKRRTKSIAKITNRMIALSSASIFGRLTWNCLKSCTCVFQWNYYAVQSWRRYLIHANETFLCVFFLHSITFIHVLSLSLFLSLPGFCFDSIGWRA